MITHNYLIKNRKSNINTSSCLIFFIYLYTNTYLFNFNLLHTIINLFSMINYRRIIEFNLKIFEFLLPIINFIFSYRTI